MVGLVCLFFFLGINVLRRSRCNAPISADGAECMRSVMEMQEITRDWQGRFCQFVSKPLCYCQVFIFSSLSACAGTRYLKAKSSQRLLENQRGKIKNI